jgi:hypothetical protein
MMLYATDRMHPDDQTEPDGQGAQTETKRRVTVREAARLLNTTVEGVRSRIKRGSLDSMRVSGTVYVLLTPEQIEKDAQPSPDAQLRQDAWSSPVAAAMQQLVDEQREQLEWFRREVERKDTIIMQMAQRIPELEPPREPREAPMTASEEPSDTQASQGYPQEERRSWWQRLFGG